MHHGALGDSRRPPGRSRTLWDASGSFHWNPGRPGKAQTLRLKCFLKPWEDDTSLQRCQQLARRALQKRIFHYFITYSILILRIYFQFLTYAYIFCLLHTNSLVLYMRPSTRLEAQGLGGFYVLQTILLMIRRSRSFGA